MRSILLASAVLLSFGAHATERPSGPNQPVVTVESSLQSSQRQAQSQRQRQQQGQWQSSRNSNDNTNNIDASQRDRLQAPSLGGLMAAASGPCVGVTVSGQISIAGFGAGAGSSTIERSCQIREASRLFGTLGRQDIAVRLLMSLPEVQEALGGGKEIVPVAVQPVRQSAVTTGSFRFN